MTTVLTIRPSDIGLAYDYGIFKQPFFDAIKASPAILWCSENTIPLQYCVVTQEVCVTYRIVDASSETKTVELPHDENWLNLEFANDSDALHFKLRWL